MNVLDDDPENHLTYFRRGTAYFALGSVRLAYKDFTQSVSLNAGFRPVSAFKTTEFLRLLNNEEMLV